MKKFLKLAILMLVLFLFAVPTDLPGPTGVVTAEAATETGVKSLTKGKSYTISGYAKVTSSDKKIATATKKSTKKYTITGIKKGTATLKCYDSDGNLVKKIYLIVTTSSSNKYSTSTTVLAKGKSKTVTATVQSGCTVKYSSSKSSVASVNSKGKITAKKAGTATISAKIYYKGTVIKAFKKKIAVVSYDTSAVKLTAGKSTTAAATVPSGYSVSYSSSKKSVATVSSKGKITAVKAGTATITATISYNKEAVKKLTKEVTVTADTSSGSESGIPTLTMTFDTSDITLSPGKTATAKATVTNGYIVSYSSSDTSVATVSSSGTITGVSGGTATITAKVSYDGTVKKTVTKKVTVRSYQLSSTSLTVAIEDAAVLKCATSSGEYSSSDVFTWSSSDKSIASVYGDGYTCEVVGEASGTATITCKVNGKVSLTCKVKVTEPDLSVTYDSSAVTISPGKTVTAKAKVTSGYKTAYSSSNTSVATVSSSGVITGVSGGAATITVKISYNGTVKKTLTKAVTVRSYKLSSTSLSIDRKSTTTLKCTTSSGEYDSGDQFVWDSSDDSIVSLTAYKYTENGVTFSDQNAYQTTLNAVSAGTATITCKVNNTVTLTCKVTVNKVYVNYATFSEYIPYTGVYEMEGGESGALVVWSEKASDAVTFEFSNDNLQIGDIEGPSAGHDQTNDMDGYCWYIYIYGRKKGTCDMSVYINGSLLKTFTVTITSTDTYYYDYIAWKAKLEAELWTDDMSDLRKIIEFGDYVFGSQPYSSNHSPYGYAQGYGGSCWASSYLLVDLAKDLGYEAEVFSPYYEWLAKGYVTGYSPTHYTARMWINGIEYEMEATNSAYGSAYGYCAVWKEKLLIYDPSAGSKYSTKPD